MNESDIDRLLRQQAPDIPVRPGLEARIHAALRQRRRRRLHLGWLALPATALVALLVFLAPPEETAPTGVTVAPPEPKAEAESVLTALNPLGSEAEAIRNDAERTGRFLIDCLPSLSVTER